MVVDKYCYRSFYISDLQPKITEEVASDLEPNTIAFDVPNQSEIGKYNPIAVNWTKNSSRLIKGWIKV